MLNEQLHIDYQLIPAVVDYQLISGIFVDKTGVPVFAEIIIMLAGILTYNLQTLHSTGSALP